MNTKRESISIGAVTDVLVMSERLSELEGTLTEGIERRFGHAATRFRNSGAANVNWPPRAINLRPLRHASGYRDGRAHECSYRYGSACMDASSS
jgi:hypothetical protein